MSVTALLTELEAAGVRLIPCDPNYLKVDAPRGVITPEMRDALRTHKVEIINLLHTKAGSAREASYIELLYVLQERAAIMEFDSGMTSEEAIYNAARDVFNTPEKLRAYAEQHPTVRWLLQLGCEIVDIRFSECLRKSIG